MAPSMTSARRAAKPKVRFAGQPTRAGSCASFSRVGPLVALAAQLAVFEQRVGCGGWLKAGYSGAEPSNDVCVCWRHDVPTAAEREYVAAVHGLAVEGAQIARAASRVAPAA